jgi:hypothetical protein
VSLAAGLPSAEGEHSRLMPLLPSIVDKLRTREETLNKEETKERNERWFSAGNKGDIYSREGTIPLQ